MHKNVFHPLQLITRSVFSGILVAFLAGMLAAHVYAEEASTAKATAMGNPEIPVAELEWLLKPLTMDERETEVKVWLDLLKQKVEQISPENIALLGGWG